MEWQTIISLLLSGAMFVIAMVTLVRNGRKDRKQDFVEDATKIDGIKESLLKANMKLDTVCATTNETRSDIKSMNEYMHTLEQKILLVEKDLKMAFRRIDELQEKIGHYHEGH